ncbi:MAG: flagellar hook-basal body complex protein FliE [Pseudomonadota bacterium]
MNIAAAASAASSYAGVSGIAQSIQGAANGIKSDALSGFGGMVKEAIRDTIDTGKASETKTSELLTGQADVVDVVTAVAETEIAFETMVTLRDKVIAAYEEIMRMPV